MINLLFGGNNKVFDGLLLTALSIADNNDSPVNMYILTMDLTDINPIYKPITFTETEVLKNILVKKNSKSDVKLIDATDIFRKEMLSSVNLLNFYTPYTYLRLFADRLELPEKILYMDTDIMVKGNLDKIFDYNLSGKEIGVVRDAGAIYFMNPYYFNAGVLLLNLPEIAKTGLFKKCIKLLNEKKLVFKDQSALNRLSVKKVFMDGKYNRQRNPKKNSVLVHFCKRLVWFPYPHTKNIKQWEVERIHDEYKWHCFDKVFDEYAELKKTLNVQ